MGNSVIKFAYVMNILLKLKENKMNGLQSFQFAERGGVLLWKTYIHFPVPCPVYLFHVIPEC